MDLEYIRNCTDGDEYEMDDEMVMYNRIWEVKRTEGRVGPREIWEKMRILHLGVDGSREVRAYSAYFVGGDEEDTEREFDIGR